MGNGDWRLENGEHLISAESGTSASEQIRSGHDSCNFSIFLISVSYELIKRDALYLVWLMANRKLVRHHLMCPGYCGDRPKLLSRVHFMLKIYH